MSPIYFLLLTVGITISTSIGKAIVLTIFTLATFYSISFYKRKQISSDQGYIDFSFSREDPNYILEISCSKKTEFLSNNIFLLFSNEDFVKNVFTYKLSFNNKRELNKTRNQLLDIEEIQDIKYSIL